ncbi:DNA-processing protein DprA [Peptoniphilus sp. SGI.035]|uniref:DNA-processing protein DprA n=1 Tax=Peptoniphilus sp. SGI.035 TaxID=3420564 RepID=UPI003CFD06D3
MEKRDLLIFLNGINFSSENSLKILNYLMDNNIPIEDFDKIDFFEEKVLSKRSFDRLMEKAPEFELIIDKVKEKITSIGVKIITILDDEFPESLRYIIDPPSVLYVKGNLKIYNPIAFVGARSHSSYGNMAVNKIIDAISSFDFTIVSGMAYGIDSLSHKRALQNNLNTIAVLGTGIDVIYPKSNKALYEEISKKGAIISEFALGTGANKFTFPMRNRIISGLSKAVVVVEAKDKSGSLITARLAAEQGKEVFAVPGNITSIYSVGTNKLIRDGAIPLVEVKDILDYYPDLNKNKVNEENVEMDVEELAVYNLIQRGINNTNDICNNLDNEVFYINKILTKLELRGIIEKISMNEFQILK